MDTNTLWSLRLGFSAKQAELIEQQGIEQFLKNSFAFKPDTKMPNFMASQPYTEEEFDIYKRDIKRIKGTDGVLHAIGENYFELKDYWLNKIINTPYPLTEKMVVFWHNHYVASSNKVKITRWTYEHNTILRENAFGNFREITKKMLRTNALIMYLDNQENIKGKPNENLSRELLELFTIGIGNYSETDIKGGAKGLAGLTIGNDGGKYVPKLESEELFTYFERKGNFKSDEMVDIIFKQKNAPYFITKKILKWFIYDNPPQKLVTYYGDYLREQDYEIQPLLNKIFIEEFGKPTAGSKIKDPLVYIIQLHDELNFTNQNNKVISLFLKDQAMNLLTQPNVKGWEGGNSWLTLQSYLQRNAVADQLCKGQNFRNSLGKTFGDTVKNYVSQFNPKIEWSKKGNNKDVIAQLKNRLLFSAGEDMQNDFESILKYDFDPNGESADEGVMRLFNYIVKTPEFQLI